MAAPKIETRLKVTIMVIKRGSEFGTTAVSEVGTDIDFTTAALDKPAQFAGKIKRAVERLQKSA